MRKYSLDTVPATGIDKNDDDLDEAIDFNGLFKYRKAALSCIEYSLPQAFFKIMCIKDQTSQLPGKIFLKIYYR